jgi:hypothetical protein
VINTELYAPLHDNVVLPLVGAVSVTADVTTPKVEKLPAVPPSTVKGVPATPPAVYGTNVNGP